VIRPLRLLSLLLLCASHAAAVDLLRPEDGSESPKPVEARAILGDDFKGAKLVGWLMAEGNVANKPQVLGAHWMIVPKIAVYDVGSGKTTVLTEHPMVDKLILGRPYWSRDGKQILYTYQGKCFQVNADGSGQKEISPGAAKGGPFCVEAWFQSDPADGSPCIGFQACENHPSGVQYGVNLYHPETDQVRKVSEGHHGRINNLSLDGTHHGVDFVPNGKDPAPALFYGEWDEGCNHSMSPDNTYRHMWLQWYHRAFRIFDPFGRLLWRMESIGGFEMIRWSWHPDFCTAETGYEEAGAGKRGIVIIKISTREMAQLKVDLGFPHLWLPSVPKLVLKKAGPVDDLPLKELAAVKERLANAVCYTPVVEELKKSASPEAKKILDALEAKGRKDFALAQKIQDPLDSVPAVREIATRYAGQPLGAEAKAWLESEPVKKETAASRKWMEIATRGLWSPDWPFVYQRLKFSDPATFEKYKGRAVWLSDRIREFKAEYAGTYAEKVLDEVARRCELPGAVTVTKERIEVVAKVAKVARVPEFHEIAPYKDALASLQYEVQKVEKGEYKDKKILVVLQVMKDKAHTGAAAFKVGDTHRMTLERFDTHPELDKIFRLEGADDPNLVPWWAVEGDGVLKPAAAAPTPAAPAPKAPEAKPEAKPAASASAPAGAADRLVEWADPDDCGDWEKEPHTPANGTPTFSAPNLTASPLTNAETSAPIGMAFKGNGWNGKTLRTTLTVPPGFTATITGCSVRWASSSFGGKLNVTVAVVDGKELGKTSATFVPGANDKKTMSLSVPGITLGPGTHPVECRFTNDTGDGGSWGALVAFTVCGAVAPEKK